MLEVYSRKILIKKLPPPNTPTLFVELVNFQPGSDENSSSSTPSSNNSVSAPVPRPSPPQITIQHPMTSSSSSSFPKPPIINGSVPPPHHSPHNSITAIQHSPPPTMATFNPVWTPNPYAPPPPPWSRWGTMSTPAMPPSTQRRNGHNSSANSNGTPQPAGASSRKRKHVDDHPPSNHRPSPQPQPQTQTQPQPQQQSLHPPRVEEDVRQTSSPYPSKRHAGPSLTPTPLSPPRPVQTLSPSLAMIVSPTNQAVHTSPRGNNQLPPLRNGASGSPLLPPVKSLISGEPRPL